jgi:hypothetical protein
MLLLLPSGGVALLLCARRASTLCSTSKCSRHLHDSIRSRQSSKGSAVALTDKSYTIKK